MKLEKELVMLIWLPVTIGIFIFFIADLLWYFGNSCLITDYYATKFNGPIEANIWLLNLIGPSAWVLLSILFISYIKLTIFLFKK